ncbi:MAG: hypothetical protein PVF83_00970 [Anaerolineales bacterium]|jgi:hypothetical protein
MTKSHNLCLLSFSVLSVLILTACGLSPEEQAALRTQVAVDIANTQAAYVTDTPLPTPTPIPTNTPTRTTIPNLTATSLAQATIQAQPFEEEIQRLYSEGLLNDTKGLYYRLDDYTGSLAKINWMEPFWTGHALSDFVLRGKLTWETAKEGANIAGSGCGFSFGIDNDFENYHIAIFALDGNVRLFRCWNCSGGLELISSGYYDRIDYMEGSADVMLIVEENRIQFHVNGEHTFNLPNQKDFNGYLTYTISSGTNYGFGTRCTFSDFELWDLSPTQVSIQGY